MFPLPNRKETCKFGGLVGSGKVRLAIKAEKAELVRGKHALQG